ncbi:hypothetical protein LMG31884_22630 [Xanthomonas hydrangeae]|uniref:DUF2523 family protein n=1 Tax=Xanthomonas hydrangeae TaxID=2775159 RepID=UPI001AF9F56D|nr:hypothetical protein LMG31884_22630 [Xanthomonas hydrangeae]CAD7716637.1 hypothetical protein LMG31884_22630 [Xanthomonas hydrangeae]
MPFLIAQLVTALAWLFKSRIGLWIMTAFVWLGINFGTIKMVVEPAIDLLTGYAQSMGSGNGELGATALAWFGVMQFDKALTMVISAVAAKHAIMQGRLFLFKRGFGAKP